MVAKVEDECCRGKEEKEDENACFIVDRTRNTLSFSCMRHSRGEEGAKEVPSNSNSIPRLKRDAKKKRKKV